MVRYQTHNDRIKQIVENVIPGTESEGGRAIFIMLQTVTGSNEKNHANYQIKHGNLFPVRTEQDPNDEQVKIVEKAKWDSFYIDGKDDGYPNGFQTLEEVEEFIEAEVERVREKVNEALISNKHEADMTPYEQWKRVLTAWETFNERFVNAKKTGKLIDVDKAQNMKKTLEN